MLTKTQEAIVAILSELKDAGLFALTTTSLVKFLYLVDYSHAKESQGAIITGIAWRFLHFGPYAASLPVEIEDLIHKGFIEVQSGSRTDKDYYLYSLRDGISRRSLESIGLTRRAFSRVQQYLRDYSTDLPKLLNFVYFDTEPMEEAVPDELLDFSTCRQDLFNDVKPIALKLIPKTAIEAFQNKLAVSRAKKLAQPVIQWGGVYDEVYEQAMQYLDEKGNSNAVAGSGILTL